MMRDGSLPIQEEYNEFISEFDRYQEITLNRDFTLPQLIYWCAPPITHILASTVKYGKYYDPNQMRYILVRLNYKKEHPEPQDNRIPTDLEASNYDSVPFFNTSQYYVRDFYGIEFDNTMHIDSKTTVYLNNNKLDILYYNGSKYKLSDLLEQSTKAAPEGAALKESDLNIPTETRIINGKSVKVPSRRYVEAIIEEIFNPCP